MSDNLYQNGFNNYVVFADLNNFNALFNSFLNFIGIFPPKYLYEDETFYKEIVKISKKMNYLNY